MNEQLQEKLNRLGLSEYVKSGQEYADQVPHDVLYLEHEGERYFLANDEEALVLSDEALRERVGQILPVFDVAPTDPAIPVVRAPQPEPEIAQPVHEVQSAEPVPQEPVQEQSMQAEQPVQQQEEAPQAEQPVQEAQPQQEGEQANGGI